MCIGLFPVQHQLYQFIDDISINLDSVESENIFSIRLICNGIQDYLKYTLYGLVAKMNLN